VLLVVLGGFAVRFQRPLRYYLLIWLRRGRRSTRTVYRTVYRSLVKAPVSTPVE
jgi:hypothetical protein